MRLDFNNQTDENISEKPFTALLERLPQIIPGITEQRVELLITDNKTIRELNKTYRDIDKATDVLSFAERELPADLPHESTLGQIVISVERAHEQANELGQSLGEELRFLFTHGLLHLLGYDHENPEDEKIMLEKAYKLLGRKDL